MQQLPKLKRALPIGLIAAGLLAACSENDRPDDALGRAKGPSVARIVSAADALAGAHIPTVDPATLQEAEIQKALESAPQCVFRYTSTSKPVLALTRQPDRAAQRAVVKLNGQLVVLTRAGEAAAGERAERLVMTAEPVRVSVMPTEGSVGGGQKEAHLMFEIGSDLKVGYGGYLSCAGGPAPS